MTVTTGTLDDLVVDVSYQNVTATFFLNGGTGTVGTNVVLRWSGTNYSIANGGVFYALWNRVGELFGPGTPEGVLTAGIGSTYRRTNGGAGTSFYVKQSGTGNTGWVGK